MTFISLLIHTCTIKAKTLNKTGYEKIASWTTVASNVACRHQPASSPSIEDTKLRINTDDDLFFFKSDAVIARGNMIEFESQQYDVIKVNKVSGASSVHHLEVVARLIDHD